MDSYCGSVFVQVIERNGSWHTPVGGSTYPCAPGYYGPLFGLMKSGLRYYTRVCEYDGFGGYLFCSKSPEVWR